LRAVCAVLGAGRAADLPCFHYAGAFLKSPPA
jgi:hypothetical protein